MVNKLQWILDVGETPDGEEVRYDEILKRYPQYAQYLKPPKDDTL